MPIARVEIETCSNCGAEYAPSGKGRLRTGEYPPFCRQQACQDAHHLMIVKRRYAARRANVAAKEGSK